MTSPEAVANTGDRIRIVRYLADPSNPVVGEERTVHRRTTLNDGVYVYSDTEYAGDRREIIYDTEYEIITRAATAALKGEA